MKTLILILLSQIQVGSYKEQTIPANSGCENIPNQNYYIKSGLLCLPVDEIFKGGFES